MVRIPRDLADRIDQRRGREARASYVRYLLDKALSAEERRATKGRRAS